MKTVLKSVPNRRDVAEKNEDRSSFPGLNIYRNKENPGWLDVTGRYLSQMIQGFKVNRRNI